MESTYQPPQSETLIDNSKSPKSIIATILFSLIGGPFIAMLYLAKPIRFFIYTILTVISVIYQPLEGIEFLDDKSLLQNIFNLSLIVIGTIDAILICRKLPNDQLFPSYSRWYVLLPATLLLLVSIWTVRTIYIEPFSMSASSMRPNLLPNEKIFFDKRNSALITLNGTVLQESAKNNAIKLAKRSNVIAYFPNNKEEVYVGRVIGLPGERIEFSGHHFDVFKCHQKNCEKLETINIEINQKMIMHDSKNNISEVMGLLYEESIDGHSHKVIHSTDQFPPHSHLMKSSTIYIPDDHVFILGDNRDNSYDNRYTGSVPVARIVGEALY